MRLRRGCRDAWIALAAVLADRLSKAAAAGLAPGGGVLLPGIVNLRPVENRGAAFSMFSGQSTALAVLTAALIAGLAAWLMARPDAPGVFRCGLWLIVGGGLGNLYDRLTAGGVFDFLELAFVRFAVFNAADVCICLGAALAVIGSAPGRRGRSGGGERR